MTELKRYTKEEAQKIISKHVYMISDIEDLSEDYNNGALNHGFSCGNFFTLDTDETKVVVHWMIDGDNATEAVADSLDELVVWLYVIEYYGGECKLKDGRVVCLTRQ